MEILVGINSINKRKSFVLLDFEGSSLKCAYFQWYLSLPGQTRASMYHHSQRHTPPLLFSILTHFLSLFLSLYSSLALPGKSKSCVTIATAAVCENYLNPSLFFPPPCVPSDIQWILFWCGNAQSSGGGLEKKKKKRGVGEWCYRGTTEQSSRAERGEEGLKVEKPGGQTAQPERKRGGKGGWEGKTGSKHRKTDVSKEYRQRSKYLKQIKTQTKSQPAKWMRKG